MKRVYFIAELSRMWNVPPRFISDLFYQRYLDESRCPMICGRREIPADYIEVIRELLVKRGKIREVQSSNATVAQV